MIKYPWLSLAINCDTFTVTETENIVSFRSDDLIELLGLPNKNWQ